MKRNNAKYFILMSMLSAFASGGFIAGEPCHEKNTAILHPKRPIWPERNIHCADMKSMGTSPWYPFVNKIKNVTSIFADGMLLVKLPYETIKRLPNLEILDVSDNNIRKIQKNTFINNTHLQTLLLSDNIIFLPKRNPFLSSQSLINLYLSNNHLKVIPPIAFTELPSLKALFLDSNLLTRIKPAVFARLQNLEYLHLGNNRLKVIPPKDVLPPALRIYITKGNKGALLPKKWKQNKQPIKKITSNAKTRK